MQISVISGSPKGEKSVTFQYVRFLEQAFPDHTFTVVHAGRGDTHLPGAKRHHAESIGPCRHGLEPDRSP